MNDGSLIKIETSDGLFLHGYYMPSSNKKIAVVYVHGMGGNFYQDCYVYPLMKMLKEENIAYLAVNNRGNGYETDFNTAGGVIKRVGSRYEVLEEAHLDITSCIKLLLNDDYTGIVLIGHSAGTIKAVRYLFEGEFKDKVSRLVLLSPIDPLGYRIAGGRVNIEDFLKLAQTKVDQGDGEEIISSSFDHDILSYKTFISWYRRDDFGRMFEFCSKGYNFPVLRKITIPTKIIVGSKDEYFHPSNTQHPEEAMNILLANIKNSEGTIIPGAVHSFAPHEDVMAKEVLGFVLKGRASGA